MADILLPPSLPIARATLRYMDSTGVSRNRYTGAVRTASLGGDRLGMSLDIAPSGGGSTAGQLTRAQLVDFLASLRGKQNRAMIREPTGKIRGSFPMTELVSNGDFSNGTTGWTPIAGQAAVSVVDGNLRVQRIGNNAAALGYASGTVTVSSFTPYVWRVAVSSIGVGAIPYATVSNTAFAPGINVGGGAYGSQLTAAGISTAWGVSPTAGSAAVYFDNAGISGALAVQSYFDVAWASCTQCLLVDAPNNLITYSEQFDNAAWSKSNATVTANSATAPDGNATADTLTPNTTGGVAHYVTQAFTGGANGVVTVQVIAKANGYNFCRLQISENTGSGAAYQVFNLNTGALGATANTGTNWADRRASITSLGNGWYLCSLTARNTNSATSYTAYLTVEPSDAVSAYAGDGTSGILAWRYTAKQEALPGQPVQVTTPAVTSATYGAQVSQINIKSAQISQTGLLLPGDWIEIITSYGSELKVVTATLNTDAGGRGVLNFSPPLRGTVSDNAPIVVAKPMGRFVYAGNMLEWATDPGLITAVSLDFEEAVG